MSPTGDDSFLLCSIILLPRVNCHHIDLYVTVCGRPKGCLHDQWVHAANTAQIKYETGKFYIYCQFAILWPWWSHNWLCWSCLWHEGLFMISILQNIKLFLYQAEMHFLNTFTELYLSPVDNDLSRRFASNKYWTPWRTQSWEWAGCPAQCRQSWPVICKYHSEPNIPPSSPGVTCRGWPVCRWWRGWGWWRLGWACPRRTCHSWWRPPQCPQPPGCPPSPPGSCPPGTPLRWGRRGRDSGPPAATPLSSPLCSWWSSGPAPVWHTPCTADWRDARPLQHITQHWPANLNPLITLEVVRRNCPCCSSEVLNKYLTFN